MAAAAAHSFAGRWADHQALLAPKNGWCGRFPHARLMIAVAVARSVISSIGPASPAATDAVPPAFRNVVGGDEGRGRARPTGAGRGVGADRSGSRCQNDFDFVAGQQAVRVRGEDRV